MMLKPRKLGTNVRHSFSKIEAATEMPNLIEVQKDSYEWFLREGLNEVLRDVSPIVDYTGNLSIEFTDYTLDPNPRYSVEECKDRSVTYDAHMKVGVRLVNKQTGELKTAQIFLGDFPLMTDNGTFVINGAERVIVSQLVRSPGVYYGMTHDKTGKELYTTTVIPNRGAWLEYETDQNDLFYVRIDKNRKIYITTFIRALGLSSNDEIREFFGYDERIEATLEKDTTVNTEQALIEVYKKLRPGEPPALETAQAHLNGLFFDAHRYDLSRVGRYKYNKKLGIASRIADKMVKEPVVSQLTGEIMAEPGDVISSELAYRIEQEGVDTVILDVDGKDVKVFSNGMVDALEYVPMFTADELEEIAKDKKIPYTLEVMGGTNSTDADVISINQSGIPTGLVSIPLRNMHTPCEVVDINDVKAVATLIAEFVKGEAENE